MNGRYGFDEFEKLSAVATRKEIDRRKQTARRLFDELNRVAKKFQSDADSGRFLRSDYKAWNELEDEYEDMVWKAYVYAYPDLARQDDTELMKRQSFFAGYFVTGMAKAYEDRMPAGFVERFLTGKTDAYGRAYSGKTTLTPDTAVSEERIQRVAADESHYINNYLEHDSALMSGAESHIWTTMGDDRVRYIHMLADGQKKPLSEPFLVGGELLLFPGDASLGATPGNLIGCRCWESYE